MSIGIKHTKEYVENYFRENGCTLIGEYVNARTKVKYICSCGNISEISFDNFKKGKRCKGCRKKEYNYSEIKDIIESNSNCILISDEYKNYTSKLTLKCQCGNVFETSFGKFHTRNKKQCNDCGIKSLRDTFAYSYEYVKKYIEENSQCILISGEYTNNRTKLQLKCGCGNNFTTTLAGFKNKNKRQCTSCGVNKRVENDKFTIKQLKNIIYNRSNGRCRFVGEEYINARTPLKLECECGNLFSTTLDVLSKGKTRCDTCSNSISKYELRTSDWLNNNNILFKTQYTFDDLKHRKSLRFDFAIFDNFNKLICLIEIDGIQHSQPINHFGGEKEFKRTKMRDKIKNEYCKNNNIKLIRIPYYEFENIEAILSEHLL